MPNAPNPLPPNTGNITVPNVVPVLATEARTNDGTFNPGIGGAVDVTAIHKATAAEISALTDKPVPTGADVLLIEDSAAGNAKKKLSLTNLFSFFGLPPTPATSILFFNWQNNTVPASSTRYGVFGLSTLLTDENIGNFYMPRAGTFTKISVHLHTNQPASGSLVIALRVGSADTALVLTIPLSSVANGYDVTGSVAVAAGSYVSVGITNNASGASGGIASVALLYT